MRSSGKPDSPLTSPRYVVYRVPYKKNYKEKMSSGKHFHNVLCLSEAKGMDITMKNVERRDRQLPYISDAEVME